MAVRERGSVTHVLAVVISTYNEAEKLPRLISRLHRALKGYRYRAIIVDDDSPDGTWKVAGELARDFPIKVIRRRSKLGLGSAVLAGLGEALAEPSCDWIATMDADLSHDPRDLPRLLDASVGTDMVQGSKHIRGSRIEGHGASRLFLSWAANLLLRLALRSPLHDNTGSYRVYSRRLARVLVEEGLPSNFEYAPHAVLVAMEHGAVLREIPITFVDRRYGKSSVTTRIVLGSLLHALHIALRRTIGHQGCQVSRSEERGVE